MPAFQCRDLGPCCLNWDADGDNLELKPVYGDVKVMIKGNAEDIHEDGHGVCRVDSVFTGVEVDVEVPMTRSTFAQLEAMIKGSVNGVTALSIQNVVGQAMFADSKQLILKPIDNASGANTCETDTATWTYVWRCYPVPDFELAWNLKDQRVFMVRFKVFPDDTSGRVGHLLRFGT